MAMNRVMRAVVNTISRLQSANITESYARQRIAEGTTANFTIASPQCRIDNLITASYDGALIPIRVFTPLNVNFSLKMGLHVSDFYRGTIIYFHGGGWANGNVDFYTDACMRTAIRLARRVVAIDYRRSPEHHFPTAVEDCYEVTRQLFAGSILKNIRPQHIVLMGDSAGANLASVVSLLARERGEFMPRTQVLLYPLTYNDHSETTIFDSVRENGTGYILTRKAIEGYVSMYLSKPEDYDNPHFAPLLANDLSNQPRTLVITAEYDPLRDEGETYAARLEDEGNEVACYRMTNAIHGYFLYPSVLSLVRDTYHIIKNFLDGDVLPEREAHAWLKLLGTN